MSHQHFCGVRVKRVKYKVLQNEISLSRNWSENRIFMPVKHTKDTCFSLSDTVK
jgi:hypothetical protein